MLVLCAAEKPPLIYFIIIFHYENLLFSPFRAALLQSSMIRLVNASMCWRRLSCSLFANSCGDATVARIPAAVEPIGGAYTAARFSFSFASCCCFFFLPFTVVTIAPIKRISKGTAMRQGISSRSRPRRTSAGSTGAPAVFPWTITATSTAKRFRSRATPSTRPPWPSAAMPSRRRPRPHARSWLRCCTVSAKCSPERTAQTFVPGTGAHPSGCAPPFCAVRRKACIFQADFSMLKLTRGWETTIITNIFVTF